MATIIAGIFDTDERAGRARERLLSAGAVVGGPAGAVVAVNATRAPAAAPIADILRDCGARLVGQARGTWSDDRWTDFDPVARRRRLRPFLQPVSKAQP